MSLYLDGEISKAYIGRFKLNSIWAGEECLYERIPTVKPEPYLPHEYFYFKLNRKTDTARVGFDEVMTGKTDGSTAITYDKTKFTNYSSPVFQYSFDKITWNSYTLGSFITLDTNHSIVYFRGNNTKPWFDAYQTTYSETSGENTYTRYETHWINVQALIQDMPIKSGGNLLSLRDSTLSDITTIPCDYCFPGLFYGCENLLTPPVLSATTLKPYCYGGFKKIQTSSTTTFDSKSYGLFQSCKNLRYAPSLPATTLANYCYAKMFSGCSQLTSCPNLPATTLADYCYYSMFRQCSTILHIPDLSATTLKPYCYSNMFYGCTQLIDTSTFSVPNVAEGCCAGMFYNCTSLVKAPELSATTLAAYCYGGSGYITLNEFQEYIVGMFGKCKSLKIAPNLPATTLAPYCYAQMFALCTSLEEAPDLPATILADCCYGSRTMYVKDSEMGMFSGCIALKKPPTISATTLAPYCFMGMFADSGITETPPLKYTTLATSCYGMWVGSGMFQGCQHLTKISTLPATAIKSNGNAYYGMFAGSNVKASATQTTECKYAFRVPNSGTGDAESKDLENMFTDASDTTKSFSPSVNTTFYINVPTF